VRRIKNKSRPITAACSSTCLLTISQLIPYVKRKKQRQRYYMQKHGFIDMPAARQGLLSDVDERGIILPEGGIRFPVA